MKVPPLHALAPTASEPPFAIVQGILLLIFIALGIGSPSVRTGDQSAPVNWPF